MPDKNFTTIYKLVVYGIIPRAMVLIAIAAIFTMLCERTAGMLSNLMNAEEQEQMIREMRIMHEQSRKTSGMLNDMVKELSQITENSMKSNKQIVKETGNGIYKMMMNVMVKTAGKALADKNDRTPEEDDMLDMMMNGSNRVKTENLSDIIKWYDSKK